MYTLCRHQATQPQPSSARTPTSYHAVSIIILLNYLTTLGIYILNYYYDFPLNKTLTTGEVGLFLLERGRGRRDTRWSEMRLMLSEGSAEQGTRTRKIFHYDFSILLIELFKFNLNFTCNLIFKILMWCKTFYLWNAYFVYLLWGSGVLEGSSCSTYAAVWTESARKVVIFCIKACCHQMK